MVGTSLRLHPCESLDEHRVAIAVEAVAGANGLGVGRAYLRGAGEGRNQEEQGRLRKVEVGHQGVYRDKRVAGADDEVGLAGAGPQFSVPEGALEGSHGGGADGDHAVPVPSGERVCCGSVLGNEERFGRHAMIRDVLRVDAREGARADVEHDFVNVDALLPKPVHHAFGEVEAGRGGGDAARFAGVDGLVPLAIEGRVGAVDVGRKRKVAELVEKLEYLRLALEPHGAGAVWMNGDHDTSLALTETYLGAFLEFSARPDERTEVLRVRGLREKVEDFGSSSACGVPQKACGNDATSIDHEKVTLSKQIRKRGEVVVAEAAGPAIESEEPRCVAVLKGRLCDQARRQVEIEILRSQNSFFCGRSAAGRSSPKCL